MSIVRSCAGRTGTAAALAVVLVVVAAVGSSRGSEGFGSLVRRGYEFVITSYSIHYTKLYEVGTRVEAEAVGLYAGGAQFLHGVAGVLNQVVRVEDVHV